MEIINYSDMSYMFLLDEYGNFIYIKNELCITTLSNTISTGDKYVFVFADKILSINMYHAIFVVCLKSN